MTDALTIIAHERRIEQLRLQRWARSCLSKKRYGSADAAEQAIKRLRAKGRGPLFTYACEHCAGWHLTKQGPQR